MAHQQSFLKMEEPHSPWEQVTYQTWASKHLNLFLAENHSKVQRLRKTLMLLANTGKSQIWYPAQIRYFQTIVLRNLLISQMNKMCLHLKTYQDLEKKQKVILLWRPNCQANTQLKAQRINKWINHTDQLAVANTTILMHISKEAWVTDFTRKRSSWKITTLRSEVQLPNKCKREKTNFSMKKLMKSCLNDGYSERIRNKWFKTSITLPPISCSRSWSSFQSMIDLKMQK